MQFVNLFRLKVFIAIETGLFLSGEGNSPKADLTLEKLGKFVAISLKWPLFISDVNFNNKLLDKLQAISIKNYKKIDNTTDEENFWYNPKSPFSIGQISDELKYLVVQKKFIDILRYGYLNEDHTNNSKFEQKYSLSTLEIDKLLKTSPQIIKIEYIDPKFKASQVRKDENYKLIQLEKLKEI